MRNATNVFGIYRTATNGNVTARAFVACKQGGTTTANVGALSRTSIYRTAINGNVTTRTAGVTATATANAGTKIRNSIYRTTINGNVTTRAAGATAKATANAGTPTTLAQCLHYSDKYELFLKQYFQL